MRIACYIFDIDGTLANAEHRLHHIKKQPKDWRAFYAACADDEPISHIVNLCKTLCDSHQVVFVSGRSDECRRATESWLEKHIGRDGPLYMRKEGDFRADDIVKIELIAQVREDGFEPVMAFDDRDRVVSAWRGAGIPCAQVAEGNF